MEFDNTRWSCPWNSDKNCTQNSARVGGGSGMVEIRMWWGSGCGGGQGWWGRRSKGNGGGCPGGDGSRGSMGGVSRYHSIDLLQKLWLLYCRVNTPW